MVVDRCMALIILRLLQLLCKVYYVTYISYMYHAIGTYICMRISPLLDLDVVI